MITEKIGYAFITYRYFRNSYFHVAFSILYFQSLGFSLSSSLALESIYYITKSILEIPGGVFADGFGRKKALIYGALICSVSYFVIGISSDYWIIALCQMGLGLSMSMTSGVDSALIYDEYSKLGKEEEYEKVESIGWGLRNLSRGIASVFGSFIAATWSMGATFIVSSIFILSSVVFAIRGLHEVRKNTRSIAEILKSSVGLFKENRNFRKMGFEFSIISIGVKVGFWAFQPFAVMHGVNLQWLGFAFAGLLGVTLVSAIYAKTICSIIGGDIRAQIWLNSVAFSVIGISFLLSHQIGIFVAISGFMLHAVTQGIYDPIMRFEVHKYANAENRATVMSVTSMAGDTAFAVYAPIFGYIVESVSPFVASFSVVGLTLIIPLLSLTTSKR